MQHYECTAELLTQLELMKGLYPGKCGYRYETGGAVNNLRRSTNIDKVLQLSFDGFFFFHFHEIVFEKVMIKRNVYLS